MIGRSAGEIAGGMMRPSDRFAVTQVPLDRLHLTALSGAFSREGSALKRELRMVRAALLCADDVTFSSQVPELMAQQAWMESLTEKTWFEAIDLPWDSGIDWLTGLEQHAEVRAMRRVQADAPAMKRMSAVLKLADLDVLDGEIAQMEQELADLRRLEATGIVRYMPVPAGWPADEQAILNIDRVEARSRLEEALLSNRWTMLVSRRAW